MTADLVEQVWKVAPLVTVLLAFLYAGHRGWWYWGPSVRAVVFSLEQQRDDWRELALSLMKSLGVTIPPEFEKPPTSIAARLAPKATSRPGPNGGH